MMKKIRLSWNEVREYINLLPDGKMFGVPRGGAIVAGLSGRSVETPEEADYIIDDIIDSGSTMKTWQEKYPDKKFIALIPESQRREMGWVEFPWEEGIEKDAEECVVRLLETLGEDPRREGLLETPKRYVKAMRELTEGNQMNVNEILAKNFALDDQHEGMSKYDQMIISREIPFSSLCEHHLMAFWGIAHIAYIPGDNGRVVGLSKLARVVEVYARRLQVQERMTQEISDAINRVLMPKGVAVVIKAKHTCQCFRGIKKDGSMVTSSIHGVFNETATRNEFLTLLSL